MKWRIYYYETARGDCPVELFLLNLSPEERAKCLAYMDLLENQPLMIPASIAKQVEGKLWELRPEFGGVEFRLLYFFFIERQIVFVHAIKKKRSALDPGDIKIAKDRMAEVQIQQAVIRPQLPDAIVQQQDTDAPSMALDTIASKNKKRKKNK